MPALTGDKEYTIDFHGIVQHDQYFHLSSLPTHSRSQLPALPTSRDPRRVGLCLHVLSRVVRDTVPQFRGPYLLVRPSSSRSWSQTAAADRDSGSGNTSTHRNNLPSSEGVGSAGPEASRQWPVAISDEDRLYQHDRYQQHQRRPRPPTPPPEDHPRPLSFPSRFSPAASAGGTVWSSHFPSSASLDGVGDVAGTPAGARNHGGIGGVGGIGDIGGRGGGEGGEAGGEAAAASIWHTTTGAEAAPLGKVRAIWLGKVQGETLPGRSSALPVCTTRPCWCSLAREAYPCMCRV